MAVTEIKNGNFEAEVLKSDKVVLVDFFATWCGPCKMLSPIVDKLAEELPADYKVCKADVDQNRELAQQYGVMSVPTLIVFKGGQIAGKTVGVQPAAAIKKLLESAK